MSATIHSDAIDAATGAQPSKRRAVLANASFLTNRALVVAAFVMAGAAIGLTSDPHADATAASAAGPDLARLLRAMAAIKSLMAVTAVGAIAWRLGAPVGPVRLISYASASAAMGAGPVLIWGMAHVGIGALLLHAGLAAAIALLWFDPATARLLDAAWRARFARADG